MKIGLCGTQSVGKTTLVKALQNIPEFQDYVTRTERSKELMAMGIPLNTDSTTKGQAVFLSERASELMCENIITDRTIIDVMAFAKASKSMNYLDAQKFCDFASTMLHEYDFIFYVSPKGVEIEDNGIREINADYRKTIDEIIQVLITQYHHKIKNIHTLEGSTEERIKQIAKAIFS